MRIIPAHITWQILVRFPLQAYAIRTNILEKFHNLISENTAVICPQLEFPKKLIFGFVETLTCNILFFLEIFLM